MLHVGDPAKPREQLEQLLLLHVPRHPADEDLLLAELPAAEVSPGHPPEDLLVDLPELEHLLGPLEDPWQRGDNGLLGGLAVDLETAAEEVEEGGAVGQARGYGGEAQLDRQQELACTRASLGSTRVNKRRTRLDII